MARAVKPKAPKKTKASNPPKKKMGAPRKIVGDEKTLQTLGGLARIQCTTKEAAAVLAVSEPTFIDFLKREKKAREVWDQGKEAGRASLRRMQFKAAESGNATMQIWLGKQYLEQRDKQELEHTGKDGEKLAPTVIQLVPVSATNDHRASSPT